MSQQTFPNGQTLVSSAQTPVTLEAVFQSVVAQIFGYDITDSLQQPLAWSAVRVAWQQTGQPAWLITEDVCIVRCTPGNEESNQVRDRSYSDLPNSLLDQRMGYSQSWQVHFTLYGPNCFDRARLIISALSLDWVHDILAALNIYVVAQWNRPTYNPENFQGQWWKRTDVDLVYNELVTESITADTAGSAEVAVITDTGVTVTIDMDSK